MSEHSWNTKSADDTMAEAVGQTVEAVTGCAKGSEAMRIKLGNGRTLMFVHDQDCCESVSIEDVAGEVDDLIGRELRVCEKVTNEAVGHDGKPPASEYGEPESYTWTFYRFGSERGMVVVRWLGESNGYYSESVSAYWEGEER